MRFATTASRRTAAVFSVVLVVCGWSGAWATTRDAGRYGGAFLRIPVGARIAASPDVVAGWRPDASLTFSNPAFMASVRDRQLFFTTSNWLDDMRFSAASAVLPFGENFTFSLGTVFLYSGGLQGFDSGLNVVSEENYYDLGFYIGASHQFGPLGIGAGTTLIRQHTLPSDGTGAAFNVGISYRLGQTLLQAAGRNLGGRIRFDEARYRIDSEGMIGLAHAFKTDPGRLIAGAQLLVTDARSDLVRFGVDYDVGEFLTIRTGIHASGSEGYGAPIEAGFGLRYESIQLEYAYNPQEYFSSTHTLSLVVSLRSWGRTGVSTPVPPHHHMAPVISPSQIQPGPGEASPEVVLPFAIVAGTHGDLSSARAETRALGLVGIVATTEAHAGAFRVVVGRYGSREEAEEAFVDYARRGYRFVIVGPSE